MRLPIPWRPRRHDSIESEEARRELARAHELEHRAQRVIAKERRLIRENHFGPKIAAALREGHR